MQGFDQSSSSSGGSSSGGNRANELASEQAGRQQAIYLEVVIANDESGGLRHALAAKQRLGCVFANAEFALVADPHHRIAVVKVVGAAQSDRLHPTRNPSLRTPMRATAAHFSRAIAAHSLNQEEKGGRIAKRT